MLLKGVTTLEISNKLKERFCKDCNIPIKMFDEPFFTSRLELFQPFYNSVIKYQNFLDSYRKANYQNEQEYFEDYNRIKDEAINFIKNSDAYKRFNSCDMNEFAINTDLPSTDIYKPSNDRKTFISIDMKKANFSALSHYDANMFDNCSTWEEFMSRFTDNSHIINSKYIRQVILGNCNPKRHITYEKFLTYKLFIYLNEQLNIKGNVVFFSNDEIVISVNYTDSFIFENITTAVNTFSSINNIEFKVTLFTLHIIEGTKGYYKDIYSPTCSYHQYEFKCLEPYQFPFVLRAARGESIKFLDNYFEYEGNIAMFSGSLGIKMPKLI